MYLLPSTVHPQLLLLFSFILLTCVLDRRKQAAQDCNVPFGGKNALFGRFQQAAGFAKIQ